MYWHNRNGQTKTCTVTNDDKRAILLVNKQVINDKVVLWQGSEQGQKAVLVPGFVYNVREVGDNNGRIIMGTHHMIYLIHVKTCTVTNNMPLSDFSYSYS